MNAVLISIKPKWCELIASGKKTVEVRKTKPKIDVPFKCYIYASQPKKWFRFSDFGYASDESLWLSNGKVKMCDGFEFWADETEYCCLNGKVIGEFVCDRIQEITYTKIYNFGRYKDVCEAETRLDFYTLDDYLKQKNGYGWHISNLVIYDKPKELGEFYVEGDCDCMNCKKCYWFDKGNGFNVEDDCNLAYKGMAEHKSFKSITRPPQSWCYVEELKGEQQ